MNHQHHDAGPAHHLDGWWAYPAVYGAAVYVAGFADPPLWAIAVLTVALAGLGALALRILWPREVHGRDHAAEARALALLAALAAGVWLGVVGGRPAAGFPALAIGLGVVWVWWATLHWRAPRTLVDYRPLDPLEDEPAPDAADAFRDLGIYPAILEAAGIGDRCEVADVERTPDGGMDIVHVEPLTAGRKALDYSGFAGHREALANALDRHHKRHGRRIPLDAVLTGPGSGASEFLLYVALRENLKGDVPYVDPAADGPLPWAGPWVLGKYEDTRDLQLTLCHADRGAHHMEIIGETGSGKGVWLANLIARATASDQGEVWVIGTDEKLQKLCWGWMAPWLRGDTDRPVIDRIGGPNVKDALEALADLVQFADLCNVGTLGDDARRPERGRGAILAVLDESSDLLGRGDTIRLYDGTRLTASQMVARLKKRARTAPVSIVSTDQDNLFDSGGSAGSKSKRNSSIGVMLSTRAASDATQPLAGMPAGLVAKATELRDNTALVRPASDEPRPLRAKAAALHGTDAIAAVAVSHTRWRFGLDPAIVAQLRYHADRWHPARHPDLTRACEHLGWAWPARPAAGAPATPPATPPAPAPADAPAAPASSPAAPPAGEDAPAPAGGRPPARPDQEAPVPDDLQLPPGWDSDDFDVLAALTGDAPACAPAGEDTTEHPGGDRPPATTEDASMLSVDLTDVRDAGARLLAGERARLAGHPPPAPLPEPLGSVLAVILKPGCPEWVPSEILAVAIGRVPASADEDDRKRAGEQLGHELNRQTGLTSEQRRTGKGLRRRGFLTADLKAAALRLGEAG